MEIQKVKISDLPVTEDLNGLKTLGTTAENTSKAAELTFIADAATSANEAATNANQAAENANTSAANADAKAEAAQKAADNATASANQADQAAVNANTATTRATAAAEKAENAADVAIGVVNEAQQATANANQAAQSANEAATNANQAAENANTSAANADAKAEAAQKAADNATASANQADQAAVNANTATTRATAAAEKAENAADVAIGVVNEAQQATANANQAAQSANEAATNANQAATSANDAATEAHTQAEYAKTQGDYAKAEGDRVLAEKGQPGGLAELDESGRVPSSQLPSYVDDVINVATYSQLPNPGESGKIYITEDTNLTYRWSGTGYAEISPSLALGTTAETAGRGDWTQAAYNHSLIKDGSNPHKTTFASLPDKPTSLPAEGGEAESAIKDGNGNVIANTYLPLSGNKMITGDFQFKDGVSVRDAAGRSVVGLLDVAGDGVCVVVGNSAKKTRIVTPDDTPVYRNDSKGSYKIYDSSNFNPDNKFGFVNAVSDLNNAPMNAAFSTNRDAANAPVADTYFQGFTFAMDSNPDFRRQLAFKDGKIWFRNLHNGSWSAWTDVIPLDNYLPLSGNKMITGDFQFKDGVSVRDAAGRSVVGLLDVAGDGVCVVVGNSAKKTRIVTPDDTPVYRNDSKGSYKIYDSSNFNPSSKLDKSVWDEAFELKTVNGVRVISAKLDFLSVAGISAYATGPSSGGGGGGLDYDLLKQALTGAITPDGYPFTISASFLGAIDKTYLTGKLANTYANKVHTHLWVDITDRPTALPANGGNADTVDNLHASSFAQIKSYNFPSGGINNITDLDFTGNIQAHFPGDEYSCIWQGKDYQGTILQLKLRDYAGKQSMMYRGSLTKIWRTVWDSGNFNPDNKFGLSGIISDLNNAPLNAVFSTNGTPANAPLENAYFQGFTFAMDNNPDFKRQWAFKDKKIWFRNLHAGSWSAWTDVIPLDNYLPLSGNKMITGDFQFKDGVSVRDAAGRSVVGLLDVAGDGVCVVVGNSAKKTRIVTPDDTPVYRNDGKGAYRIYDSSNSNISTVDWAAKNITAAGTVTATKLVLGGITIDVYNGALRVNGNLVATGGVTAYQ